MGAVRLRFAAELRGRWRGWLGLALLVGLASAVVVAAAAGARRTDSAYVRFLHASRASDVLLLDDTEGTPHVPDAAKLAQLPQVEEVVPVQFVGYMLGDIGMVVPRDDRPGATIDRFKLLSGRLPDPRRPDEVVVGFALAEQEHLHVGSRFPLIPEEYVAQSKKLGIKLPRNITFRVVGIEASPGEFPPQPPGLQPLIHGTLAFYREYKQFGRRFSHPEWSSLLVRLRRGEADVPAFLTAAERIARGRPIFAQTQRQLAAPVRRSFHLQAVALWILGVLVAVSAVLVFAQAIARQAFLDSTEVPTLRALGMTRAQLLCVGMLRTVVVAVPAGLLAAGLGFLLSPLTPIGEARIAEPSPGFRADVNMLAGGGIATMLLVLVVAAIPSWRGARLAGSPLGTAELGGPRRSSAVTTALSRVGASPTALAGARMALEPGRGRTAVPVRTTLAGLGIAVAALTATLVFGASLDHLLSTPRLYGWNWDLQVTNYGSGPDLNRVAKALSETPGISELSIGGGAPIDLDGVRGVDALAIDGPVAPPVVSGRRPAGPDEIALGAKTMRQAGLRIGESIDVHVPGLRTVRMKVVGRAVVPPEHNARLGEGALITQAAVRALIGTYRGSGGVGGSDVFIRLTPGADRNRVLAALRPAVGQGFGVVEEPKPTDIVNFGRVKRLPLILAGILALLASTTLAHTLLCVVRRRQRDLAIFRTLGFVRRQVIATVLWQATTLAAVAVIVGVPLGVSVGRWSWAVFADRIGIVRDPVVPAWPVAVVVAGAVLVANLLALVPGRLAAGVHAADALRAE